MEQTDPDVVALGADTGHLAWAGADPAEPARGAAVARAPIRPPDARAVRSLHRPVEGEHLVRDHRRIAATPEPARPADLAGGDNAWPGASAARHPCAGRAGVCRERDRKGRGGVKRTAAALVTPARVDRALFSEGQRN
jgi:hypothetical protein